MFCRNRAGRTVHTVLTVAMASVLLFADATSAAAQIHSRAITVTGGWSRSGDLTPGFGFETILEDGFVAGAQAETWFPSRWFGLRLNASYADRLVQGSDNRFRIVAGDAGLVVRLLPPRRDRIVAPVAGLGVGVVFYRAEAHAQPLAEGMYGDDPVMRPILAPSIGVDLFPDAMVGVRLEVADKIVFPSIGESPDADGFPRVHNPRVRAGLQLRVGRPPPAIIVAQRPAEPEPAPEPAGTRPPEPEPPAPPPAAPLDQAFTVQVGAFVNDGYAARWADGLRELGAPVRVVEVIVDGLRLNRVRVGALDAYTEAERLAEILFSAGYPIWVTTLGPGETVPADIVAATHRFMADR